MAPAITSPAPIMAATHFSHYNISHHRHLSVSVDDGSRSDELPRTIVQANSRRPSTVDTSSISSVVYSLKRRSSQQLGSDTSSRLLNSTHDSILEWISVQRMRHLPPEGSSHDKVLAWAQLFVERLHAFELAIEDFAGDSYLATHLAYGYCIVLLELGKENASVLMTTFGFFYNMSMPLLNLLERAELFSVSQEIKEQLVLTLSDLVTLVSSVSTHFHRAIRGVASSSVSVNIYGTFPVEIKAFTERCGKTAESMWRHQLMKEGLDANMVASIKTIKTWVSPEDNVLTDVVNVVSHLAHDREELTCLWMGPFLTRFLKGPHKTLAIHGKPGCGKTVLASVIVDHLQHPIGGVTYTTLFIPISARIPAEVTSSAIAKAILCQLFEKRIGNVQLLQTLFDACERTKTADSREDYDGIVWSALDRAMSSSMPSVKELVVIVDGINEASCEELELIQKLTAATTNGPNIKLITLGTSQPPATATQSCLHINDDLILDDLSAVVRGHIENAETFARMSELDQEMIVTRIAQAAKSSFLWAALAAKRVRQEDKAENIRKMVDSFSSSNAGILDFALHAIQFSGVSDTAKSMLLWLAVSERPLSLKELAALNSIQAEKSTITDPHHNVQSILKPLDSLIILQDGLATLRHTQIREAVWEVHSKGKLLPAIKDPHADMTTRLLFYLKHTMTQQHEPSLTILDAHETNQLLTRYPLLDFAIRYWPVHFRQTSSFAKEGDGAILKSFIKVFPTSTSTLLLQSTLWEHKPTPTLLAYHAMVTNICRQLLTSNNTASLQAMITLSLLYQQVGLAAEAIPLFYEATIIANALLTTRHNITMHMASTFTELTESIKTSTKSDIMVKREEVLLVLAECYKTQCGSSSEVVITTLNQLVEHYLLIKEEKKAQSIIDSIENITTNELVEHNSTLHMHLRRRKERRREEESVSLLLDAAEYDELIEGIDSYDFEFFLKQAEKWAAQDQTELAENAFLELWQRVSQEYRMHHSELWESRKIKAVISYSKFLHSEKRHSDSCSILLSFWEECSQSSMSVSETSIALFTEMAAVMKTLKLSSQSLNLLRQCSQYYQSTNHTESSSYREIERSIQITSTEIMQSASSSVTMASESTLEKMVLESSSSIITMDKTTFTATFGLIRRYISQHRWEDTTRILKRILHGVWPSLFSSRVQDVTPPPKHVDSCVELAERLAECYHARRRLSKEEDLRVRLYQAMRPSRKVDDKLRSRVTADLLSFLQRASQAEMVINIRQQMLDDYAAHYGSEHTTVIKMLWTLAELTRPRPIFVEYYQRIISVLNKDSHTSTPEAFQPVVIVANELWNKGLFTDTLKYHAVLFATFLKKPDVSSKLKDEVFIRELFTRYMHCLRSVRSDITTLYKTTLDYKSQCKAIFGATASVTIQAILTLATVCQESMQYEHEAVALYEELITIKSDEIDHHEISAILDSIHEEQASLAIYSSSESISSTQVYRAVKVLKQRLTSLRESHGWAHEESMSKLTQLVMFYSKQEDVDMVRKELNEATINVVSSESSSTRLMAAASTIATCYIESHQVHKAIELKEIIYNQVIMKDTSSTSSCGFDVSFRGRESLVFLAQLEYSLRHNSSTVNEILAELTTQFVYFEDFRSLTKSKCTDLHNLIVAASRLHQSLVITERKRVAARVFDDFVNYFLANEGKRIKLTKQSEVKVFLTTLLDHFSTHKSRDFVRSVGISCNDQVHQLLKTQAYDSACDLALAGYTYISSQKAYRTATVAKLILILGMTIGGRDLKSRPNEAARKRMLATSGVIIQDVLRTLSDLNLNLEQVSLNHLNNLIGLLGEQQDYHTLAWLLTAIWNSREAQRSWHQTTTLALGRRFIMARYLVGDSMAAIRLAEDIVYNCRRVHGSRHPSTLEMSIFLTQLYTSVAQRYQNQRSGGEMSTRYYKKSAAIHENILRIFSDPSYAEMEGGLDRTIRLEDGSSDGPTATDYHSKRESVSDAQHVRTHLKYLKLAVERLGCWPKDYGEYQRLNADVFREFGCALKGIDGLEKWNLTEFGCGKAESNADLLNLNLDSWELVECNT